MTKSAPYSIDLSARDKWLDKSVLITGGANGLGLKLSEMFLSLGAAVTIVDIDGGALERTKDVYSHLGSLHTIKADIRKQRGAHTAFEKAAHAAGHVDILINNLGMYPRKPLFEIDDDAWDAVFDVNLRSMFHMSVAAAKHMMARKVGKIVSIASIDAYVGYAKNAHYAAAKAGVVSLTRSLAQELAPSGILVCGVAPGAIDTPTLRSMNLYEELAAVQPLARMAMPADIAQAVIFLASDNNTFITGETIVVCGGKYMR